MEAEVADAAENADNRTRAVMVGTGMSDNLSSVSIYLGGKS
jgi:hypothetical protein